MKNLKWYVAYTYSKSERKVHQRIKELGIESFLPLHRVKRQYSDRIKLLEVPLFTSYLFVKTTESILPQLLSIEGIARFVSFANDFATIRESEIEKIKAIIAAGREMYISNSFAAGQRVMLNQGPFAGMEGVLVKEQGKNRFIVTIEALDQNISIDIPTSYFMPAQRPVSISA